jgi:hypothetical protein
VANAFISPFNTQNAYKVILNTTALLCFPKNLIPWRDSNPGLLIPEAYSMATAPRRQGFSSSCDKVIATSVFLQKNPKANTRPRGANSANLVTLPPGKVHFKLYVVVIQARVKRDLFTFAPETRLRQNRMEMNMTTRAC